MTGCVELGAMEEKISQDRDLKVRAGFLKAIRILKRII